MSEKLIKNIEIEKSVGPFVESITMAQFDNLCDVIRDIVEDYKIKFEFKLSEDKKNHGLKSPLVGSISLKFHVDNK